MTWPHLFRCQKLPLDHDGSFNAQKSQLCVNKSALTKKRSADKLTAANQRPAEQRLPASLNDRSVNLRDLDEIYSIIAKRDTKFGLLGQIRNATLLIIKLKDIHKSKDPPNSLHAVFQYCVGHLRSQSCENNFV